MALPYPCPPIDIYLCGRDIYNYAERKGGGVPVWGPGPKFSPTCPTLLKGAISGPIM